MTAESQIIVITFINLTAVRTLPVLRPGLRSCLPLSSLHPPSMSLSAPSPCCERDSDSEWAKEGVSEPWLRGEEERDGDSRNRRIAGWFSMAGSLLVCWDTEDTVLVCPPQPSINKWNHRIWKFTSGSFVAPALA